MAGGGEFVCDLYLAPSTIPHLGRGIFAGRHFIKDETLEIAATLAVRHSDIDSTMVDNYVFAAGEEKITMLEFGPGMLYNHKLPTNYYRVWNDDKSQRIPFEEQVEAHTTYATIRDVAFRDLQAGEEIFGEYCADAGECNWFKSRGIEFNDFNKPDEPPAARAVEQLASEGHCLSQVYVSYSTLPQAGRGLFARRRFTEGEIVTISPVLLLKLSSIDDGSGGDFSVLMNYCMAIPNASVALLPFGLSAMANHAPTQTPLPGMAANMKPEWFYWDEFTESTKQTGATKDRPQQKTREMLQKTSLEELSKQSFTQLDFAFRATRDIETDEELFYSYGSDWESAWEKYVLAKAQSTPTRPVRFRTFIGDNYGLYFPHWHNLVNRTHFHTLSLFLTRLPFPFVAALFGMFLCLAGMVVTRCIPSSTGKGKNKEQ